VIFTKLVNPLIFDLIWILGIIYRYIEMV
jgi:hypothetical protein